MTAPIEELIVGVSPAVVALRRDILRLAPVKLSVLVEGPTGSGKELVAQALHDHGRKRGRLVATNVSAINESVFENEMFGHVRGAYTGAFSDATGLLREANDGTLFLDEIGGLTLAVQVKLLRALETGAFRPVGGRGEVRSAFRVVSATNESLTERVGSGHFRADLLHRLGAVVLRTTSLDSRKEDIPALAASFAERIGHSALRLHRSAIAELQRLDWPGNVRELRHFVELALELHEGRISADTLRDLESVRSPVPAQADESEERTRLIALLDAHRWNAAETAGVLDMHVSTLYRQMRRLKIRRRRMRGDSRSGSAGWATTE